MTIGFKLFTLWKISSKRIFTYMMLFSVLCLLLPCGITDKLDHAFSGLVGPLSKQSRDWTLKATQQVQDPSPSAVSPLEYEVVNLRQRVRQLEEEKKQWANLPEEYGKAPMSFILADVIGRDSAPWSQDVFLNRGSAHGIRKGQFVIGHVDEGGSQNEKDPYRFCIVGRINEIRGPSESTLQLITDAKFQWPVFIEPRWNRKNESWEVKGTLAGDGKSGMEVKRIRADFPVKVGDSVIAQSQPDYLPVRKVVGIVKRCERDHSNAVLWHITVKPAADLNALRQLVVICPQWTHAPMSN